MGRGGCKMLLGEKVVFFVKIIFEVLVGDFCVLVFLGFIIVFW